jgi:DNA-directed RNA polymerase subunit RPC12/RpoP
MSKLQSQDTLRPLSQFGKAGDDSTPLAGIACPQCGCRHMRVGDTDPLSGKIRRYRICRHCGRRTVTFERPK